MICPALVFRSVQDHVVDPVSSQKLVARAKGPVEQVMLERSFHVATLDWDKAEIEARTVAFVTGVLPAAPRDRGRTDRHRAEDREDVIHVARLARLDLSDEEVEAVFTAQLRTVLDHAADVRVARPVAPGAVVAPERVGQRAAGRRAPTEPGPGAGAGRCALGSRGEPVARAAASAVRPHDDDRT